MPKNKQILFAHLGYMKYYGLYPNKIDSIQNGGRYIVEHHFGHEELNFQNLDGFFYGFVEQKTINLKKISPNLSKAEYLDNVLVIFFATRPKPEKGAVIVGWYNNAQVFSDRQSIKNREYKFFFKAAVKDSVLLPELHRDFEIETFKKDRPGQSHTFFLYDGKLKIKEDLAWVEEVLSYINNNQHNNLIKLDFAKYEDDLSNNIQQASADTSKSRQQRLQKTSKTPKTTETIHTVFIRNADVIAEVLQRAKDFCEFCKKNAPFIRASNNTPYLEVHHKIPLAQGGDDSVENAVALCPNCHKKAHFGKQEEVSQTQ